MILAPLERAREFTDKPVRVLGIAQASDYVALDAEGGHHDVSRRCAAPREKAYAMAGVGPDDIQFAEAARLLHDRRDHRDRGSGVRFERGEGGPYALDGYTLR